MATKAAQIPSTRSTKSAYEEYVNPQWVSLLNLLGLNEEYERCQGTELYTKDGRRILDFLSGYCVHNAGHNHPYIGRALKDEQEQLDVFVEAIRRTVELADSSPFFWTEALSLARRAAKILTGI